MIAEQKALKKEQKRLKREAKARARFEKQRSKQSQKKINEEFEEQPSSRDSSTDWTGETSTKKPIKEKEVRKNLFNKKNFTTKEKKDKIDWKLGFKEFPVKMVKEVSKIKWSGKRNLTSKFIQVIIFMLIFAVIFYFVDWAFQALFTAIHVI